MAAEEIARIENSVKETDGTNRPGSTLGDGTSEAALAWEIQNGRPYMSTEGHYQKLATYEKTINDAIPKLQSLRSQITEPAKLAEIDAAIQSGTTRAASMRGALDQWNNRATIAPDVWNPDGISKIHPNWPSDTGTQ